MSHVASIIKELFRCSGSVRLPTACVQEFLYRAQGWSLILRERQLFSDDFEPGATGPALANIAEANLKADEIDSRMFDDAPDASADEVQFVRAIWESDAAQQNGNGHDQPVSIEGIEEYFAAKPVPSMLQEYAKLRRNRDELARRALAARPQFDPERLRLASTNPPLTSMPQ